jgi:PRC-barrel domain
MRTSRQVYLFPALVGVWLGQFAPSPVSAQTPAGPGPPSIKLIESQAPATKRNQLESVLGREVRTRVEEDVGRVVDLLADRQGRVQAAVIEFGGFLGIGTRKIAVEWSALSFVNDGRQPVVIVEMTRNQLRVATEYKPSEPAVVRRTAD